MNQQAKYGIIGLVVIFVAAMVWLLGRGTTPILGGGQVTYTSSNWDDKYGWDSKDPYGTNIMHEMITESVIAKKALSLNNFSTFDSLVQLDEQNTYLFLGEQFGIYDHELNSILEAVKKGSDVFIISSNLTANIFDSLMPKTTYRCDYAEELAINWEKKTYNMNYLYQRDTLALAWKFFINAPVESDSVEFLSTVQGRPNFLQLKRGKGSIYVHSNPACFFNYQLLRKDGLAYAKQVVKKLDAEKKVYYLEFGRLDETLQNEEEMFEDEGKKDDSYLQFVFQSPSLIAAMLLSIFGLLLFVMFRAKRMRPQVEVIKPKRNMSKVFVETVSSIYRNKENPSAILQLHKKNFYTTVYKHFFIDLSKRKEKMDLEHLSSRTGIDVAEIETLLNKLDIGDHVNISDDFLVEAIRLKQDFYSKSGIITDKIQQRINEQEIVLYRSVWLSFGLIFLGISMVIVGLYLLVVAKGAGILLWPIGSLVLSWGILRMSRPLVKIHEETFTFTPLFGKKKVILFKDTMRVARHQNMYEIIGANEQVILLPLSELNRLDRNKLDLFLLKQKFVEL